MLRRLLVSQRAGLYTRHAMSMRHATREISYAHSAESKAGRALIRTVENLTGRISLIRQAKGYEDEVAAGRDFWRVMVERYGLELDIIGGSLSNIPSDGPLIVISNHPYGILDGLILSRVAPCRPQNGRSVFPWIPAGARSLQKWWRNRTQQLFRSSLRAPIRGSFRLQAICTARCGWRF